MNRSTQLTFFFIRFTRTFLMLELLLILRPLLEHPSVARVVIRKTGLTQLLTFFTSRRFLRQFLISTFCA